MPTKYRVVWTDAAGMQRYTSPVRSKAAADGAASATRARGLDARVEPVEVGQPRERSFPWQTEAAP